MKFSATSIPGVRRITGEPYVDERGAFCRLTCDHEFEEAGIIPVGCQSSLSENTRFGTLRGFHYQLAPHAEDKMIVPLVGALYDIVVDLRPGSPRFLQWESHVLNSVSRESLYVPKGCANAWMTLYSDTTVLYYMSQFYKPEAYRGIRYNDPRFKFTWPIEPTVVSLKDRSYPDFDPAQL